MSLFKPDLRNLWEILNIKEWNDERGFNVKACETSASAYWGKEEEALLTLVRKFFTDQKAFERLTEHLYKVNKWK